ncbi:MAG TPA: phenylalanine--tRNA ligase subunit beta, partial [Gammaproteobacteria bacterium]|nr:phenylalanine--tRNA ligase subunit beta [Gammaproteobacteria bacterium]
MNTKLDTQDLMDELTMAGLEAEGSDPVAREFSGIIVGEVESVESHPNADKLSVCKVNDGAKSYQVVCGATNVRQGIKVPFANIGAEIHTGEDKPFQIKSAKLRGIESKGMICSSEELGLEEKSEGIMVLPNEAPLGVDVRNYLQLNDTSIELTLTPNRGDCLGILGLAREVGVISGHPVTEPEIPPVASTINDELPIRISAKDGCPRYLGRIIRNVNLKSESPLWMQEKLRRSGLRSIDPIVDVTNFVLMELGQPMHAFDYSKLKGHINVRMAKKNEKLILLDGKEVDLSPEIMLIADKNKPVAMAGIMGGLETSVTDSTKDVFLECAFFSPLTVAGKARRYGMQTDASHRYERGVDYNLQHKAMERATLLLLEIVGGEAGPITEAVGNLPKPVQVELNIGTVSRTLGVDVARKEIIDILSKLGFVICSKNKDSVTVDVPSFRFDVTLEADLIEEIARIYGYNKVPSTTRFGGRDFVS